MDKGVYLVYLELKVNEVKQLSLQFLDPEVILVPKVLLVTAVYLVYLDNVVSLVYVV